MTISKGIVQPDALIVDAKVATVNAAFGAVHTARLSAVAVVQQFGRQTSKACARLCAEAKRRHSGAVLSEIDDEMLARTDNHRGLYPTLAYGRCRALVFAVDNNCAVGLVACALYLGIDVGAFGIESPRLNMIHLSAAVGHDNAFILLADCRRIMNCEF